MHKFPQVLINVPVKGRATELLNRPAVQSAVAKAQASLGESGRVLLRPSGTEPLIRVMVEGPEEKSVRAHAEQIADSVRAG
jgi:phosphoglucosamine mutase